MLRALLQVLRFNAFFDAEGAEDLTDKQLSNIGGQVSVAAWVEMSTNSFKSRPMTEAQFHGCMARADKMLEGAASL